MKLVPLHLTREASQTGRSLEHYTIDLDTPEGRAQAALVATEFPVAEAPQGALENLQYQISALQSVVKVLLLKLPQTELQDLLLDRGYVELQESAGRRRLPPKAKASHKKDQPAESLY